MDGAVCTETCGRDLINNVYILVNVHKTKYMKCTRRQEQLTRINIENKEIEQVKAFK